MKSGQNSSNQSAIKRIIPAVAMFALSAVMLTSSTYAWFTMNKEVEMKGLNMSATVGSGMEIALACVSEGNAISTPAPDAKHPSDEDTEKGWTSSVVVGQYYSDIGKLRPASSVNGENFFDAIDASSGGGTASNYNAIELNDSVNNYNMAKTELRSTLDSNPTPTIESNGAVGYYVDIPVYLRTNKKASETETSENIYCKIKIKNNNDSDKLYNAVRVVFVKDQTVSSIFGVNDEYYVPNKAAASEGENGKGDVSVVTDFVTNGNEFVSGPGADTGLDIPFATNTDKYGHLDFKVRVWIEGESTSCSDSTSGQDWNIDLAFAMGPFETNP